MPEVTGFDVLERIAETRRLSVGNPAPLSRANAPAVPPETRDRL
jgi:hypothetical protein